MMTIENALNTNTLLVEGINGFPYDTIIHYGLNLKTKILIISLRLKTQDITNNLIKYIEKFSNNNFSNIKKDLNNLLSIYITTNSSCKNINDVEQAIDKFLNDKTEINNKLIIIDDYIKLIDTTVQNTDPLEILDKKLHHIALKNHIPILAYYQITSHTIKDLLLDNYLEIEKRYDKFCAMNEVEKNELLSLPKNDKIQGLIKYLQAVLDIATRQKGVVIVFSPIIDKIKLVDFLISVYENLNLEIIEMGNFSNEDWEKLAHALKELSQINTLHVITEPLLTSDNIDEYCNTIFSWYTQKPVNCILIDYFNFIEVNTNSETEFQSKLFIDNLSKKYNAKVFPIYRNK